MYCTSQETLLMLQDELDVDTIATDEDCQEFVDNSLSDLTIPIPEHFDARHRWPDCWTIGQIDDQGSCGACYVRYIRY